MRYWTLGLLGVAICSAAVAVVAWCTYALTRVSLCEPGSSGLACETEPGQLGIAIGVALIVAIPVGSKLFARRKAPRGAPLGPLAIGLALCAAGGAALWSALGSGSNSDVTEAIGFGVAAPLLCIGLFAVIGGLSALSAKGDARAARIAELRSSGRSTAEIAVALSSGDGASGSGGATGGSGGGAAGGDRSRPTVSVSTQTIALGTLAEQLSQIAAARQRTGGDALAARLRQLDDLRASGLLSADEHAAKRREILEEL